MIYFLALLVLMFLASVAIICLRREGREHLENTNVALERESLEIDIMEDN